MSSGIKSREELSQAFAQVEKYNVEIWFTAAKDEALRAVKSHGGTIKQKEAQEEMASAKVAAAKADMAKHVYDAVKPIVYGYDDLVRELNAKIARLEEELGAARS